MTDLDVSKLRKKLAKKLKQRQRNPRPNAIPATKGSSTSLQKRMVRDHQDVLHNIEFALVSCHQEHDGMDDSIAMQALTAAKARTIPEDPIAARVVERIQDIRETRPDDLDDSIWNDGIRVVMDSVRRHSRLRNGETRYLDFVSRYVT